MPAKPAPSTAASALALLDSTHVARVRRMLAIVICAIVAFMPIDAFLYLKSGDPQSLLMAGGTGVLGLGFLWARRLLAQGRIRQGILLVSFLFQIPVIGLVFIAPHDFPILAVGPLLGVASTIPLARGRLLTIISVFGWTTTNIIIAAGTYLGGAPSTTSGLQWLTFDAGLSIVIGLVFLLLWQFGFRFDSALHASRDAVAALHASNEKLKQLDQFKSQFMNNAAHEINTPLTPIRLQLHVLRSSMAASLPPTVVHSLDIMDRNVERVTALVRDVLDASRIQGARLALHPVAIDLQTVAREAFESFGDAAKASGVHLVLDAKDPVPLMADPRRVTQVFFNLLGNALKFTPRSGTVGVSVRVHGDRARVEVSDSGVGLEPDEEKRLFQPFSQLESGQAVARGGTGLGLFISRGIAEEHGGAIGVTSGGRGKGSTFWVDFPLRSLSMGSATPSLVRSAGRPQDVRIRDLI